MKPVLEVCAHSVESAVSAERGGAMRLELCANLMIGGTSPDEDLFRMVRERVSVPVRVLLRPRCGDFLYTESEFELLCRQVKRFAALGADGIVIGVLTPEGDLDEVRMEKLIALAGGCGVTLHRAFDVCRDPFAALETAKRLGVDTILTSGQQADCTAGADLLRALVAKMEKLATDPEKQRVYICHGDCLQDAEYVASLVREKFGITDIRINYVGPVIGAHTGPGVVSLFFVGSER